MIHTYLDRYIDTYTIIPRVGDIVMINVGLAQARPNYDSLHAQISLSMHIIIS